MLIESKIKIGYDIMLKSGQANFISAHLPNKMALVQFQTNRTVHGWKISNIKRLPIIMVEISIFSNIDREQRNKSLHWFRLCRKKETKN